MVTSLFKNKCFSLFAAFNAGIFLFLMSFIVSARLPSSLQFLQLLSLLALSMVYSSVFVSVSFNARWASFTDKLSFIFFIALILVDILMISSAYC